MQTNTGILLGNLNQKGLKKMNPDWIPQHECKRTARRPIFFDGEQLAFATTKTRHTRFRWTDAIFYRNDTRGGFVAAVGHKTDVSGERDNLIAEEVKTVEEGMLVISQNAPELADQIQSQLEERKSRLKHGHPAFVKRGNHKGMLASRSTQLR